MAPPPISVTGPRSLDHAALLLGARAPDWFGGWDISAQRIVAALQEGEIPYTNIAALAYKVIIFYSKANESTIIWSSPQEVFSLLQARFETAAPDDLQPSLQEFVESFTPLITEFCYEKPTTQIVWGSESEAALSHGFGMCHEPCIEMKVDITDTNDGGVRTNEDWDSLVESAISRKQLQENNFDEESMKRLLPSDAFPPKNTVSTVTVTPNTTQKINFL